MKSLLQFDYIKVGKFRLSPGMVFYRKNMSNPNVIHRCVMTSSYDRYIEYTCQYSYNSTVPRTTLVSTLGVYIVRVE